MLPGHPTTKNIKIPRLLESPMSNRWRNGKKSGQKCCYRMTSKHRCTWEDNRQSTQIQTSRLCLSIVVSGTSHDFIIAFQEWAHGPITKWHKTCDIVWPQDAVSSHLWPISTIGLFKCMVVYIVSLAEGHGSSWTTRECHIHTPARF